MYRAQKKKNHFAYVSKDPEPRQTILDDGMDTRGKLFQILLNQTQIGLYLLFSSIDLVKKKGHCPFFVPNQSEKGEYNLISS